MTAKNAIALYMRAHNARARGSDSNLILSQISWKFVTLSAFFLGHDDGGIPFLGVLFDVLISHASRAG